MADSNGSLPLAAAWENTQQGVFRKYKPYEKIGADEIRLLKIVSRGTSRRTNEDLVCTLTSYRRSEAPSYTALSYAWGYGWADCQVLLNNRPFCIRRNLYRFLQHAARLDQEVIGLLWIDAICIDQDDLEERAAQVQHMQSIFSSAKSVFAWLGPAYQNSHKAMQYLEESNDKMTKQHYRLWGGNTGQAIANLCGRQYWTRLWVLQELMLAKDIWLMCGDIYIRWDLFRDFLLTLQHTVQSSRKYLPHYQYTYSSPAMRMVSQVTTPPDDRTMLSMLLTTEVLKCEQEHDKIFALLGLVNNCNDLQTDYTIPIPILMNQVLQAEHNRRKPETLDEVASQCKALEERFQHSIGSMFELIQFRDHNRVPVQGRNRLAYGNISLWWALHYGHDQIKELLLSEYVVSADSLWQALEDNDAITMHYLLALDWFDINAPRETGEKKGDILILNAANANKITMLKLLLDTPRLRAGHIKRALGSIFQRRTNARSYIRHQHAFSAHVDENVAEVQVSMTAMRLLLTKVDVSEVWRDGTNDINQLIAERDIDAIELLSHAGASKPVDPSPVTSDWQANYLETAARVGSADIIALLVDRGYAQVNAECVFNETVIFTATRQGSQAAAKVLLDRDCRHTVSNLDGRRGWTVLHEAASYGLERMVEFFLVDGRVDPYASTRDGQSALNVAIAESRRSVIEVMRRYGMVQTPDLRTRARDVPMSKVRRVHRRVDGGSDGIEVPLKGIPSVSSTADRFAELGFSYSTSMQDPAAHQALEDLMLSRPAW